MTKVNKIDWDDLTAQDWEREIAKDIAEDAEKHGSMASEWLRPTHPLFAERDDYEELDSEDQDRPVGSEYDKIQSTPYDEFEQEWDEKMRKQRKEASGRDKRSTIPTGT